MDNISRVIKQILGKNPALKQGMQDARILEIWPKAVGEALAKHAIAVQVKNKTLFIEVDHPIWKQELHSNKQLALKRLNDKISEILNQEEGIKPSIPPKIWIEELFFTSAKHYGSKTKTKY